MSNAPKFSIILAGGKGTRMQLPDRPKVCCPVNGVPAINRAIAGYNECGIQRHIVVVGAMAGQVVETVGREFENVQFVYQPQQLGTANAAKVGLHALSALEEDTDVLLVSGDRLVDNSVLRREFDIYYESGCELALVSLPKNRGSGRIVMDDAGSPVGIVEVPDIAQRQVFEQLTERLASGVPDREQILATIERYFTGGTRGLSEKKAAKAFGDLWHAVAVERRHPERRELQAWIPPELTQFRFTGGDRRPLVLTPEEAEACPTVNVSIYVGKVSALNWALSQLHRGNAQGEEYLTDIVEILARRAAERDAPNRIATLPIEDSSLVLGFNDPQELAEVESVIRARQTSNRGVA